MNFDLLNKLIEKHLHICCYKQVDSNTPNGTNHIIIDYPVPNNYFVYIDNDLVTFRSHFNGKDQGYSLYSGNINDIFIIQDNSNGIKEIVNLNEKQIIEYCERINRDCKILAIQIKKNDLEKDFYA